MLIVLFLLFVIISVINISGEFTPFRKKIRSITTPLLIPSLALYIFASRQEIDLILLIALTCGWVGNILLIIRDGEKRYTFFIWGLLAFAVGHIFYLIAFTSRLLNQWRAIEPLSFFIATLILITAIIYLIFTRKDSRKIFSVLVLYTVILTGLCCINILSFYPNFFLTSIFGIIGALLFLGSNITLSIHQLIKPLKYERPIAISTYILAQYSLAVSLTGTYPHPWW